MQLTPKVAAELLSLRDSAFVEEYLKPMLVRCLRDCAYAPDDTSRMSFSGQVRLIDKILADIDAAASYKGRPTNGIKTDMNKAF